MAQRLALIRVQVDALAAVAASDLGGAGALELFDGAHELGDRLQGVAVKAL